MNDRVKQMIPVRLFTMAALGVLLGLPAAEAQQDRAAFLDAYCMKCHNGEDYSGGLAFDLMPLADVTGNEAVWEKVLVKAGVGMMPPPGEKQPDHAALASFLGG